MRLSRWTGIAIACLPITLHSLSRAASAEPAGRPTGESRLDDETFRRGLRARGLVELLERFDRDHPPRNDIERALRSR